jgi:hypothetical protein
VVFRITLLLCCAAAPVFGQDTTAAPSTPHFRRGQWVAHFDLGSFTTFGAARFRSPTRATVLQFDVSAGHTEINGDSGYVGKTSSAAVTARLGWRSYRAGLGRVTPYYTFGPMFSFSHRFTDGSSTGVNADGWGLGLFADLGALYHVAEWLALGAAGDANLRYFRSTLRSSSGSEFTQWDISFTGIIIRAGLTLKF